MRRLKKGFVQVYTGDGKGKTTAALGLALRAVGAGYRVRIIQFMKGRQYSESGALKKYSRQVEVFQTGRTRCIRREEVTNKDSREAQRGLNLAFEFLNDEKIDILILDEILVAYLFGLVPLEKILELIDQKPNNLELILTGRGAPLAIIEKADLVTEMREIKHYYQRGVSARKGIES